MTKARKSAKNQNPDVHPREPKPKHGPKIDRGPHGMSVIEAGRLIGLSRNSSYEAAKAGIIPTIKVGALMIVPKAVWLRQLGIADA